MDAAAIQQAYLQAIYTGHLDGSKLDVEELCAFQDMDSARLKIESAARCRNLRTVLHDDMRILKRVQSKECMLSHVNAYCASPDFWHHRGRTLIEDFCLFLSKRIDDDPLAATLARIEGVYSGLSVKPTERTPWAAHSIDISDEVVTERFSSAFVIDWTQFSKCPSSYAPIERQTICCVRRTPDKVSIRFVEEG